MVHRLLCLMCFSVDLDNQFVAFPSLSAFDNQFVTLICIFNICSALLCSWLLSQSFVASVLISSYPHVCASQNDKSIQEFYIEMTTCWDQLALMEPSDLQLLDSYTKYREKQRLVQFLMALRDQFKPLRGAILHRSPLPSVDGAIRKLIAEETRFKVAHGALPSQSVFATPPLLPTPHSPLFQVTGKPKPRVSMDECSFCHQKGHWKHACPKLLQPKGRSFGPPSFKSTSSGSRSSAVFSAPGSENGPSSNMQSMFEQFKSFMVANPNISSQPSTMTTTQFGLSGSSPSGSGIQ